MPQFRKKPVVIEAWQNVPNAEVPTWFQSKMDIKQLFNFEPGYPIKIATLEGVMEASVGDWIIQGVKGEVYPCMLIRLTHTATPARLLSLGDPAL